jgi:hypothetical protein
VETTGGGVVVVVCSVVVVRVTVGGATQPASKAVPAIIDIPTATLKRDVVLVMARLQAVRAGDRANLDRITRINRSAKWEPDRQDCAALT